MKSLDVLNTEKGEILQRMQEAMKNDDKEAFGAAFSDLAEIVAQRMVQESQVIESAQDVNVLASRGVRQLTHDEKEYYNSVIEAMKSGDPKQALANIDKAVPETVIDSVFEDIKNKHELLSEINFQNTGLLTRFVLSTTSGNAVWGPVGSGYGDENELSASFADVDLTLASLTAWIPVKKYMLDLGPEWLDRYVREVLAEAIAAKLEYGIVAGTGKNMPIGMMKALTGAVDGVYANKEAVEVTDLSPETFGTLLETLTTGPNDKRRAVSSVILIVNPADYFTKVFPATTVRTTDGTYSNNVFPFPTKVIQSAAVPSGKAVIGIAKRYFMGLGTQKGGKIEVDDSVKFMDRERVYAMFLYGYGYALDENAFLLLDISGLTGQALQVYVTNADEFPAPTAATGNG